MVTSLKNYFIIDVQLMDRFYKISNSNDEVQNSNDEV